MEESKTPRAKRLERHLEGKLLAGVLVLAPLLVTYLVLRAIFNFANSFLQPFFTNYVPGPAIPGAGVITLVAILYVLGLLATSVFGHRIINPVHAILSRVPVVKMIYGVAKQATDVLHHTSKQEFKRVVLVDFPREGMKALALVTGQTRGEDGSRMVVLYIPTAPNPTSGFLAILPEHQVTETDLTVDEVMKIVLSGGILAPSIMDGRREAPAPSSSTPGRSP